MREWLPSWLLHWENNKGSDAERCSVMGCLNEDLVGGHVYREDEDGDDCYIIPLCRSCNHFTKDTLVVHHKIIPYSSLTMNCAHVPQIMNMMRKNKIGIIRKYKLYT